MLALALTAILAVALVLALWPRGAVLEGPPYVIALDAGHGGGDVGATGLIYEVELTERTVELLYDLLAADEDFKPVLCRRGDESLTPLQRAKEARRLSASVLFSVHGNAAEDAGVSGFECFPVTPGREWHAESLRLAGLVAAEMGAAGAKLRGENGVRYVYYENGEEKTFREVSDTTEYPYETFGVVEHAGCIALLAEQCFITNAQDVEAFGTEAGCAAAAACYYRAIRTFFDTL